VHIFNTPATNNVLYLSCQSVLISTYYHPFCRWQWVHGDGGRTYLSPLTKEMTTLLTTKRGRPPPPTPHPSAISPSLWTWSAPYLLMTKCSCCCRETCCMLSVPAAFFCHCIWASAMVRKEGTHTFSCSSASSLLH
jgi:hypothetical protein